MDMEGFNKIDVVSFGRVQYQFSDELLNSLLHICSACKSRKYYSCEKYRAFSVSPPYLLSDLTPVGQVISPPQHIKCNTSAFLKDCWIGISQLYRAVLFTEFNSVNELKH